MFNKPLDLKKPVQTRDGSRARIIATDANTRQKQPIVALVQPDERHELEVVMSYSVDGAFLLNGNRGSRYDLINVPIEKMMTVYLLRNKITGLVYPCMQVSTFDEVITSHCFKWKE